MKQTWHWYGPDDPIPLADARQVDTTGMVTMLHHIPNGEVWSVEEILKHKTIAGNAGLMWSVVKSVPIHEDIRTHTGNYEQWTVNYQRTLRNLVQCGIRTVCYNFMPAFDWARTDLEYVLPDGSKALRFDQVEFTAFGMRILRRPGAEADYTEEEIAQTAEYLATMSDKDKVRLTRNIIAGLSGAGEGYTLDQFREHPELHKDIDKTKLRRNFAILLKATIPATKEVGVRMAVRPDGPPRPILDLPCIVSTTENMQWMVDAINSMVNGLTMRTGSYGVCAGNDLVDMIRQPGPCIYFTHLRSTVREDNPRTFHEATHLNGNVGIYEVVKTIVEEEHRHKVGGGEDLVPMRPDCGHQVLGDLKKKTSPGYSAIGRLKGLAEVRGVELAI